MTVIPQFFLLPVHPGTGLVRAALLLALAVGSAYPLHAQQESEARPMYIREYRIRGSKAVGSAEIGEAVYPYLGPGRLPADVDRARAAVEKLYRDKGYQAVAVGIPVQQIKRGTVILEVAENPVGRLRVRGARFNSPSAIKALAPAMAEGQILDFKQVEKNLNALNQVPGRQVTPKLVPGVVPGTVDIDLVVKDSLPLHGSLELNNRYSPDTTPLRLNGAISYDNLWQLGHTAGFSFQLAPENFDDAKVFSAYYLARLPNAEGLSVMLTATKQDSNVSTLGGTAVAGRGEIVGVRVLKTLPAGKHYQQSLSAGFDYKHLKEDTLTGGLISEQAPISYVPFNVLYTGGYQGKDHRTDFNGGVTFHLRGLGASEDDFDHKRYKASGSFIYFKGDVSHTRDLPQDWQLFLRLQGQMASQALVNSEQFSGGGLGTVRGYLESEALGDDGVFGTIELRGPSLLGEKDKGAKDPLNPDAVSSDDWRLYGFLEGGALTIHDGLPGQDSSSSLMSVGLGTRGRLFDHLNGSLDAGLPLLERTAGRDRDVLYTFRLWGDF